MPGDMNVPKQFLDVLPCDPFEQLDIARKITSNALSTRVSSLESESSILQQHIAARDDVIVDLESKLRSLDFSLSQDLHNLVYLVFGLFIIEQLDIARKITSIALSTRVSSLESETSILLQDIAARDDVIVDLQSRLHSLDFSLSQDLHNLSLVDHQKVYLFYLLG
nr:hypothetical protein CTI12_AA501740 [Tanacetum cinerariifolium]